MSTAKKFILNAEQRVYVEKAWGHEDWIYNGKYCGKKLFVEAGKSCSWHYHKTKDEVIYCQSGEVEFYYGWDEDPSTAAKIVLTPDSAFHVPPGMVHRFAGVEDSLLIEFSTHHNEKDVVRLVSAADIMVNYAEPLSRPSPEPS